MLQAYDWDKNRLLSPKKEKRGSVTFGDDGSTKIVGKGTVNLGSKMRKEGSSRLLATIC